MREFTSDGRPGIFLGVRLRGSEVEALDRYARARGMTRNGAAKAAVVDGLGLRAEADLTSEIRKAIRA